MFSWHTPLSYLFFFFNDTATTEIYTLSLHDALPICVTGRIYSFAVALVGWMKGGLGQVNIIGSVIFSGMSGTAIADAAGPGTIEIKGMKDHGYLTQFSRGVTAPSPTPGAVLPPAPPVAVYGMMGHRTEKHT